MPRPTSRRWPCSRDLAGEYAAAKRRRGVLDYSDQVAGALEVVRSHDAVAAELRDRFRVVLLDEYQDTSVAQTDLLAALFRETAVMAVGDPHQAIYGWRGASAGNLGGFPGAFATEATCARFALLTSWRNSAAVLTAANAVLAPLAASAPVTVDALRPRPGAPDGAVEFAFDADLDTEADHVAEWFARIRAERRRRGEATTGAILFRSKKHMVRFGDALGRRGIPHRILGLGGLLSTPEVVDVVSALRVISDPAAGSSLIRLLAGPRWAIGLADLRVLAQLARRLASHDAALQPLAPEVAERIRASAGDDQGSLVDALDFVVRSKADHSWLAGFTPEARERLREAGAVLAGLRQAAGMPIPDLVRLIEVELRLDVELAANEARGPARIASAQLRAFVDELHAFLAADETGALSSLLAWLDHAERLDEFAPRTEPPEDDVVQLLTIHGSKGLEWDAVAVVRLVKDELPSAAARHPRLAGVRGAAVLVPRRRALASRARVGTRGGADAAGAEGRRSTTSWRPIAAGSSTRTDDSPTSPSPVRATTCCSPAPLVRRQAPAGTQRLLRRDRRGIRASAAG